MSIFDGEARLSCNCESCDPWRYENDLLTYVAEDVETLPELVKVLRMCADYYEERYRMGWRLVEPVQNGMVELQKDD